MPNPTSFAELVDLDALRRFEPTAWAEFYDALAGPLLGYLRGMGAAEPEDLLGETFVQVTRDLAQFAGTPAELRPWVYTIARHRMVDDARLRRRRPVTLVDMDGSGSIIADLRVKEERDSRPDPGFGRTIDRALIRQVLGVLTTDQREVIWLRYFLDLDAAEVGKVTGRSANAVAAMTIRALRMLRYQLQAPPS